MAETITPVVHGGKRRPYLVASALHVVGATLSAAALGFVLAAGGALLGAPWDPATPALVAGVAALYLLREAFRLPIPLPDRKRQVPEWWRTFFSPPTAAFLYGTGLGVGFLTYLSFGTFVAVMAGAFASGDLAEGASLCAAFGLGRSLAIPGVTSRNAPVVEKLDEIALGPVPRLANAGVLALVMGTAAASAL